MVTDEMVALVPQLHSFARSLCRDGTRAEDLVQEALARALRNIDRFTPGTNLKAWLFTIVRNEHYSQLRRRKFEAAGVDTDSLPEPSVGPDHDGELELRDLNRALGRTVARAAQRADAGQRERLLLRGGGLDLRMRGGHHQEPRGTGARHADELLDGGPRPQTRSARTLQALRYPTDAGEQRIEQIAILALAGAPALQQVHLHQVHRIDVGIAQLDRPLQAWDPYRAATRRP